MQIGCLGHICKIWGQTGYSNIYIYQHILQVDKEDDDGF